MDEMTNANDDSLSDDQRAVAEYFASDSFREAKLNSVANRAIDDYPLLTVSIVLFGLLTACSVWAVAMLKVIENVRSAPSFPVGILMTDAMVFPISTVMTFAVTIAIFWRGPLWRRVLVSLSIIVPAMLVLFGLVRMAFDNIDSEVNFGLGSGFFGLFVGASVTTVLFEMFSSFTLMEGDQVGKTKLAPTNLRAFFELTIFFAIIFVGISIFPDDRHWIVILCSAGWSALLAKSVIALCIAFLNDQKASKVALFVSTIGCTLSSFIWTASAAIGGFSWSINFTNFLFVASLTLIGVAIQVAFLSLGIRIVRSHGCVCVNRRKIEIGP